MAKQFEEAANEQFGKVGKKEGVYVGKFDPATKTVKVAILDKEKKGTEISGTGLIAGLLDLYKNHNLTKVQVGQQPERDLKAIADKVGNDESAVQIALKQIFGLDVVNAVQTGGNSVKLADFIDKSVDLKLTVEQPDCNNAVTLTYHVSGAEAKSVLLKDKLIAKDLKVWVGDTIDWKKGVALKDANEELQAILNEAGTVVTDQSNRNSENDNLPNGAKGNLNVAFDDGTSLEIKDQVLYVSNHMTAATNDKAPADAVLVKFLLGEGVKAKNGAVELEGKKDQPAEYGSYKVKPGTDLDSYVNPTKQTIFKLINATADVGPTWFPENHVVSDKNNIFTAEARLPMSKAPVVDKIVAGDKKITGEGVPGATIEVTFPGVKTPVKTTVGTNGTWSVNVPKGITLYAKDKITVVQTEKNKNPKAVTAVVKAKSGDSLIVTPVVPGG